MKKLYYENPFAAFSALAIWICFIGAFTLPGCSTLGYENVDTTRKAIVVSIAEVRAANLLLQDLIERRAIGREPATRALNKLQEAKNYLDTALSAIDVTRDVETAGTNLQRANSILAIALQILAPLIGDE